MEHVEDGDLRYDSDDEGGSHFQTDTPQHKNASQSKLHDPAPDMPEPEAETRDPEPQAGQPPEPQPESQLQPQAEPEPEIESEVESETKSETQSETQSELQPASLTYLEPEPMPEIVPASQSDPESELDADDGHDCPCGLIRCGCHWPS